MQNWRDVVAISVADSIGLSHSITVGLKADGSVLVDRFGVFYEGNEEKLDTSIWRNIVAVATGGAHIVGLKSDGTVAAVGDNYNGECNVSDWKNVGPPSEKQIQWRSKGLCLNCGGQLSGLFTKKCKKCGYS